MNVKLQMALLRRKELQAKVDQLKTINNKDLYEVKAVRRLASEGIDDIVATIPKLTASQVTKEYDFYARQLRLIDAAIQQTNWTVDVEIEDSTMADFQ